MIDISKIIKSIINFFKELVNKNEKEKNTFSKPKMAAPLNKNTIKRQVSLKRDPQFCFEEKNRLLKIIEKNIIQLYPIAEGLNEKELYSYEDKILDLIEQSKGFIKILDKLDTEKPYASSVLKAIREQTAEIKRLIIKLYSD